MFSQSEIKLFFNGLPSRFVPSDSLYSNLNLTDSERDK